MSKGIPLSAKHGVNPTLGVCWYCGKEDGTIGLLGKLPGDAEAPRHAIISREPCDECKERMKMGVMFIEVEDGQDHTQNLVKTGRMWVIKDEAIERMIASKELKKDILKKRFCVVEERTAKEIGLPREEE